MEDSYTVHRRRKAAARKREKTPEPPKRRQDDVTETDDDEDARAKMEKMVQETERLEALEENERQRAEKSERLENKSPREEISQRSQKRAVTPEVRRSDGQEDEEKPRRKQSGENNKGDKSDREEIASDKMKTSGERRKNSGDKPKTSRSRNLSPEVEARTRDRAEEPTRNVDREAKEGARAKKRRDVENDLSPEVTDKASIGNKFLSPDKLEKSRPDGENRSEERHGSTPKKSSSRVVEKTEDDYQNRYEVGTRDNDELVKSTGAKSSKNETAEQNKNKGRNELDDSSERGENSKKIQLEDSTQRDENLKKSKREDSPERGKNSRKSEADGARTKSSRKQNDEAEEEMRVWRSQEKSSRSEEGEGLRRRDIEGKGKMSSKEERTGYTTDSSETEEAIKRSLLRRKKSPEGAKLRRDRNSEAQKKVSRSRPTTDTDGDPDEDQRKKRNRRRRSSESGDEENSKSRQPVAPSRHPREKIKSSRYSSEDEARVISKSETFPVDYSSREKSPSIARSSSEMKKKIIPLSDDSLIADFERAQLDYLRKERSIFDPDPMDDYVDPKVEAAFRRRKFSVIKNESENEGERETDKPVKKSWFSWLFGKKTITKEKKDDDVPKEENISERKINEEREHVEREKIPRKISILEFFRVLTDCLSEFRAFVEQNPQETRKIRILRNRCLAELLLAIIYCGLGAFVFRFTEGAFETFYKCGVKRVKRDFLDSLWNFSHNMREEDWKSMARRKLMEFEEQLHTAHEAGVHSYSGQKSWSFLNAVAYCLTVITTIGYGHISPSTTTGRAITIVYAIFGIPMFLIILADFGKLFTRGIKFLWAFVRRVYYTGSCRKVRRTVPVQEVMKGVQLVYDLAKFRRPSQMNPEEIEEIQKQQNQTQTILNLDGNSPPSAQPGTPGTPALSTFEIDDEFNLPISVAIFILVVYIFVGATVYNFWEQWGFFESFYFVFISMSTIGFGDYVPKHPIYMMLSIIYLVFGLALTSMCINVVQVMLSDSFKQASQKIGATIGFEVTEEDGSVHPAAPPAVEVADVHTTIKESESEEQVAPRAKQEDVEL